MNAGQIYKNKTYVTKKGEEEKRENIEVAQYVLETNPTWIAYVNLHDWHEITLHT